MSNEAAMSEAPTTTEGQAASTTAAPAVETPATAAETTTTTQQTQQAAATKAPESYEFKAPEGREFSPEVIAKFSEVAKDADMSQEQAQKVLDGLAPAFAAREEAIAAAAKEAWTKEAQTDAEFGGAKFDENLGIARKAMNTFGSPALRQLFDDSGLGDHPEIIRAFYKAGKAISEDRFVNGTTAPSAPQSVAQRMYPNMNP
jgi:hypothetical protein